MVLDADTADSPRTNPTERSIPPVMMTNVSAHARRSEVVARWMMFWKLLSAKKFFPVKENTTRVRSRKKNAQLRPSIETAADGAPLFMARTLSPMRDHPFVFPDSTLSS